MPSLTPEQRELNSLAMSVTDFLLSRDRGRRGGGDEDAYNFRGAAETSTLMDADPASCIGTDDGPAATAARTSSSTRTPPPLECFQGPGGVMYLVMSLVTTRGIDRIRDGKVAFSLSRHYPILSCHQQTNTPPPPLGPAPPCPPLS
jgi:hypothetical protein